MSPTLGDLRGSRGRDPRRRESLAVASAAVAFALPFGRRSGMPSRRRTLPALLALALALALAGCSARATRTGSSTPSARPASASSARRPRRARRRRSVVGVAVGLTATTAIAIPAGAPARRRHRARRAVVHRVPARRRRAGHPARRGRGRAGHARAAGAPASGGVAGVDAGGEGGLLGVAVSPAFATDRVVHLYFTADDDNRIVRTTLGADGFGDLTPVLTGIPKAGNHNGGRIAWGPDGFLYVGTGDAAQPERAQDRRNLGGKILRVTADGRAAPGNPFGGSPVWSLGHRNVQGLAWGADGTMYASEFGQNTWDELNVITPGSNYGWPEVEGIEERRRASWRPSPSGRPTTPPPAVSPSGRTAPSTWRRCAASRCGRSRSTGPAARRAGSPAARTVRPDAGRRRGAGRHPVDPEQQHVPGRPACRRRPGRAGAGRLSRGPVPGPCGRRSPEYVEAQRRARVPTGPERWHPMAAIDDILQSLPIDQLAQQVGADPQEVQQAAQAALPALLGGLQANAQDPGGASSIVEALGQHDDDLLDGGVDLGQVDEGDGQKIASHIFGPNEDQVYSALGGTRCRRRARQAPHPDPRADRAVLHRQQGAQGWRRRPSAGRHDLAGAGAAPARAARAAPGRSTRCSRTSSAAPSVVARHPGCRPPSRPSRTRRSGGARSSTSSVASSAAAAADPALPPLRIRSRAADPCAFGAERVVGGPKAVGAVRW